MGDYCSNKTTCERGRCRLTLAHRRRSSRRWWKDSQLGSFDLIDVLLTHAIALIDTWDAENVTDAQSARSMKPWGNNEEAVMLEPRTLIYSKVARESTIQMRCVYEKRRKDTWKRVSKKKLEKNTTIKKTKRKRLSLALTSPSAPIRPARPRRRTKAPAQMNGGNSVRSRGAFLYQVFLRRRTQEDSNYSHL
jgi:hypothetical protein